MAAPVQGLLAFPPAKNGRFHIHRDLHSGSSVGVHYRDQPVEDPGV